MKYDPTLGEILSAYGYVLNEKLQISLQQLKTQKIVCQQKIIIISDPTKVFDVNDSKVEYNTTIRNLLVYSKKTIDSYKLGFLGHMTMLTEQVLSNTYLFEIQHSKNRIKEKYYYPQTI